MADRTKCTNHKCELKENCKRWLDPDSEYRQSYAYFEPKDGECEMQIPIKQKAQENE